MAGFRSLALFTLIMALLPWGAHTSAFAARTLTENRFALAVSQTSQEAVSVQEQTISVLAAPISKRCHGPAVLGSPCGPQAVVPDEILMPTPTETIATLHPGIDKPPAGMKPPSSLDPPRSC